MQVQLLDTLASHALCWRGSWVPGRLPATHNSCSLHGVGRPRSKHPPTALLACQRFEKGMRMWCVMCVQVDCAGNRQGWNACVAAFSGSQITVQGGQLRIQVAGAGLSRAGGAAAVAEGQGSLVAVTAATLLAVSGRTAGVAASSGASVELRGCSVLGPEGRMQQEAVAPEEGPHPGGGTGASSKGRRGGSGGTGKNDGGGEEGALPQNTVAVATFGGQARLVRVCFPSPAPAFPHHP